MRFGMYHESSESQEPPVFAARGAKGLDDSWMLKRGEQPMLLNVSSRNVRLWLGTTAFKSRSWLNGFQHMGTLRRTMRDIQHVYMNLRYVLHRLDMEHCHPKELPNSGSDLSSDSKVMSHEICKVDLLQPVGMSQIIIHQYQ